MTSAAGKVDVYVDNNKVEVQGTTSIEKSNDNTEYKAEASVSHSHSRKNSSSSIRVTAAIKHNF